MATIEERLAELRNKWFLMEPAYFMVLCTHKLEISNTLKCSIAVGGGVIYISDTYFNDKTDKFFEESMKVEILRILLKHPYQRQLPNKVKMFLSSNFVIANNISKDLNDLKMKTTRDAFNTYEHDRSSLEEIYDFIKMHGKQDDSNGDGDGQGNKSKNKPGNGGSQVSSRYGRGSGSGEMDPNDLNNFDDECGSFDDAIEKTQFWKEDEYRVVEMNNIISKIDRTNSWGNMPGSAVDEIKKSIEPKFNYKAIFQQFRSTVISSARTLTRMRPNRRFGYDAMGSKRDFTTKILVAVDTSGSISDEDLALALGFINNFFKYGISQIDTIQFDTQIHPESLKKLTKKADAYPVTGRGGTDFNDVFKYTQETDTSYNGVIILTDGYASHPSDKWLKNNFKGTKYIWCLNDERNYNHFKGDTTFAKFGKCTFVDRKDNEKI